MPDQVEPSAPEVGDSDDLQPPQSQKIWLHGLLFVATCGTTFFAGGISYEDGAMILDPVNGLLFSVSIMGILLSHEMAHYFMARRHGVDASLPYFVPLPLPPIGTFGAIIRMREPPRTRASLLDIGSSGPLAGLFVAVIVCFIGLRLSELKPMAEISKDAIMEGNSLLYLALKNLAHPELGPGFDIWLHPVAWAGWVGILITSLNLLPAGQLDGGHVLYSIVKPRTHFRIGRIIHYMIFILGLIGLGCRLLMISGPIMRSLEESGLAHWVVRGSGLMVWLAWTILFRFVGGKHPPIEDADIPLGRGRLIVGVITLIVLVLTFTTVVWSPIEP